MNVHIDRGAPTRTPADHDSRFGLAAQLLDTRELWLKHVLKKRPFGIGQRSWGIVHRNRLELRAGASPVSQDPQTASYARWMTDLGRRWGSPFQAVGEPTRTSTP